MSYQDFVRQVNAELLAINGTDESLKDDVIQNEKKTEMDFTDNEMDTSVWTSWSTLLNINHNLII
jgi:hypothetical protein